MPSQIAFEFYNFKADYRVGGGKGGGEGAVTIRGFFQLISDSPVDVTIVCDISTFLEQWLPAFNSQAMMGIGSNPREPLDFYGQFRQELLYR